MNIALEPKPNALLIEDNADDRLNIKLQLEVMGFNVFDVSSTSEAKEIFAMRDYSIPELMITSLNQSSREFLPLASLNNLNVVRVSALHDKLFLPGRTSPLIWLNIYSKLARRRFCSPIRNIDSYNY